MQVGIDKPNNHDVFTVHRNTLLRASDVLAELMNQAPDQDTIDLPAVDPPIAKAFLTWAYDPQSPIVLNCKTRGLCFILNVIKAYDFGLQINAPVFCNAIADTLHDNQMKGGSDLDTKDLTAFYDLTEPGSLLRRLALDIAIATGVFNGVNAKSLDARDRPISVDTFNALEFAESQEKKLENWDVEDLCKRYHLHPPPGEVAGAAVEVIDIDSSDDGEEVGGERGKRRASGPDMEFVGPETLSNGTNGRRLRRKTQQP